MSFGFAYLRLKQAQETGTDPVTGKPAEEIFGEGYTQTPNTTDPMQDILENKNLIFQVLLIKMARDLMKTDKGLDVLKTLGSELIKGSLDTTHALAQASAANAVSSWANPVLISGIFERLGLLPPAFNAGYHAGITAVSGVDIFTGVLDSLFGKGGAFPSYIQYSSRGAAVVEAAKGAKVAPQ